MRAILALIISYFAVTTLIYAASIPEYYYHRPQVTHVTKELKNLYRVIPRKMIVRGRRPNIEATYASNVLRTFGYVVYMQVKETKDTPTHIADTIMKEVGDKELLDYLYRIYPYYFKNNRPRFTVDNTNNKYLTALNAALQAYNTDFTISTKKEEPKEHKIEVFKDGRSLNGRLKEISRHRGYYKD